MFIYIFIADDLEDSDRSAENQLIYVHKVYDILTTDDASELSIECISQYSDVWDNKVAGMREVINEAIDEDLCDDDTASVLSHISSFASIGVQVIVNFHILVIIYN